MECTSSCTFLFGHSRLRFVSHESVQGHMRHFTTLLFFAFECFKCLHCGTEEVRFTPARCLPRHADTAVFFFFLMKATVLSGNIRSYARRFITEIFHQYCRWIPCCYCSSSTSLYPSSARRSLGRGGCQGFMRSPVGSKIS